MIQDDKLDLLQEQLSKTRQTTHDIRVALAGDGSAEVIIELLP
jgi:hypothetical protein